MDTGLIQLLQQGNREAFSILYDHYWKNLLSYAGKRLMVLEDAEEAEEVVQDVFVNLWERHENLEITGSLSSYLQGAVRYKIYNKYRAHLQRKQAWKIPLLEDADYSAPAMDSLSFRELQEKLKDAIQRLPEKCREAFILSREHQLSYKEISERMGVSVNTVENTWAKHYNCSAPSLKMH